MLITITEHAVAAYVMVIIITSTDTIALQRPENILQNVTLHIGYDTYVAIHRAVLGYKPRS